MSMKKKALAAASYVMVAALAIGGTVAYLTDRDNATNTFTMGNVDIELNEDFEQGAELLPNVKIDKKVTIENTGKSDAYVWYTYAVPTALKEMTDGDNQVKAILHCNLPGRYWNGYHTNQKYWTEDMTGPVDENDTWIVDNENYTKQEINGVEYNVYVVKYTGAITPGEVTNTGLETVYLDANVDIDPEGNLYYVKNGVAEKVDWNINKNGAPKIYVNAYGIQADGFDTVEDAYAAYVGQWGKLNGEYEDVSAAATGSEVLAAVAKKDANVLLTGEKTTISEASTINLNGGTLTASRTDASAAGSSALDVRADTTLTGTGTVENEIDYCLNLDNNATLTIESGTYKGVITAVNVVTGTLKIQGGSFEVGESKYGSKYLINCKDEYLKAGTANIVITGGTFKNWDPSASAAENPIRDFVADGYKVVFETDVNGDVWYTVVKE